MGEDNRDFISRWYSLDLGVQIAGDWFAIEGASFDETRVGQDVYVEYVLRDIHYFVGPSMSVDPTYIADVAAQVGLGLPLSSDSLRALIEPVLAGSDQQVEHVTIEYPADEDDALWALCRPTGDHVENETLDDFLRQFVKIVERLVEAVN